MFELFGYYSLYIFILIIMLPFLIKRFKFVYELIKDLNKYKKIEFFENMQINRGNISKTLLELKTANYQKKYLLKLKEKNAEVMGEWKNFPKLKNYSANLLLAQLEEKWLGLK